MDVVNRLAPKTDLFVEIEPNAELGAPADPTTLAVEMYFSATRRIPDTPTFFAAAWRTDDDAAPPRYYAHGTIDGGTLAEGVWWPFVKIHNVPEVTIVAGPAFRVS